MYFLLPAGLCRSLFPCSRSHSRCAVPVRTGREVHGQIHRDTDTNARSEDPAVGTYWVPRLGPAADPRSGVPDTDAPAKLDLSPRDLWAFRAPLRALSVGCSLPVRIFRGVRLAQLALWHSSSERLWSTVELHCRNFQAAGSRLIGPCSSSGWTPPPVSLRGKRAHTSAKIAVEWGDGMDSDVQVFQERALLSLP
jgi:hypothetical protein